MPTETPPKRRRLSPELRRRLILDGAMQVFAERGYEAASMEEIARAGGITPAVIYDHFPSKAKLQVELLERQTTDLLEHVGAALQGVPADPAERMRVGVDAFFAFVEQHRFAWRMLFREPPSDPEVSAAYMRLEGRATRAIAAFIEAGAGDALARYADPERVTQMFAEALKAAQNGLAAWWYEHPEVSREEVVERLLELCWVGLERMAAGGSQDR
ncbi:MAG TPA: TetR/AcrR family transcriptional regulator [Solirubrobacteraceae bacterium]|jgi:AcrR family transcriptional regulator|nr:TetR/AcrR family transcriptional regulator [Solirubrobacteraceae bacterium]